MECVGFVGVLVTAEEGILGDVARHIEPGLHANPVACGVPVHVGAADRDDRIGIERPLSRVEGDDCVGESAVRTEDRRARSRAVLGKRTPVEQRALGDTGVPIETDSTTDIGGIAPERAPVEDRPPALRNQEASATNRGRVRQEDAVRESYRASRHRKGQHPPAVLSCVVPEDAVRGRYHRRPHVAGEAAPSLGGVALKRAAREGASGSGLVREEDHAAACAAAVSGEGAVRERDR